MKQKIFLSLFLSLLINQSFVYGGERYSLDVDYTNENPYEEYSKQKKYIQSKQEAMLFELNEISTYLVDDVNNLKTENLTLKEEQEIIKKDHQNLQDENKQLKNQIDNIEEKFLNLEKELLNLKNLKDEKRKIEKQTEYEPENKKIKLYDNKILDGNISSLKGIVKLPSVNIRKCPSVTCEIVSYTKEGNILNIEKIEGKWYKIQNFENYWIHFSTIELNK